MIRSFRSRALALLWNKGDPAKLRPDLVTRAKVRLTALVAAKQPEGMDLPGFNFHKLRGKPARYSVHVNGPWCITFGWESEDAVQVDLENYH